jgi:hypothetical protein
MMWRRNSMSNDQARAALRRSGNSFQDAVILGQVPAWRRGRVRRLAEADRITGTTSEGYELYEPPGWEAEYTASCARPGLVGLDGDGRDQAPLAWHDGFPQEAA